MEILNGIIDSYIFYNEDNGYAVVKLEQGITATGFLPKLNKGENVEFTGEWVNHPRFGSQFKIDSFKIIPPATEEDITRFLSSGIIKGIREATAFIIVRKFGAKTMDVLDTQIDRLYEIKGMGKKRVEQIKTSWNEHKKVRKVVIALQALGLSTAFSMRIYNTYGEESVAIVKNNPYRLTYDVWGIGFKTADKIGMSLGFGESHPGRIKAGIIYVLNEATRNGNVYLPEPELIKKCTEILNHELTVSDPVLLALEEEDQVVIKNKNVYLSTLYHAERNIEERIKNLTAYFNPLKESDVKFLRLKPGHFTTEQLEAVRGSVEHKILILTGGPGTGKTETLKGIIHLYEKMGKKILLAAPTGRAAKRMTEVIGREAKTIHRLLEYNPTMDIFNFNAGNPLQTNLLVIDEMSMVDTLLMDHLLNAVSDETTLVLVGDSNQLPSVGPGNILADLIRADIVPVIKLNKIFRQSSHSKIIVAAHEINRGEFPALDNKKDGDLFFIEESDEQKISELILDLCRVRLPQAYHFDPVSDIQVITPMHKGELGTDNLNILLQQGLNSGNVVLKRGNSIYRAGDKVMQLRNNYEKEIFNGDIGLIIGNNPEKNTLQVSIDNRVINYDINDLDEITFAYTVTVHKSQGSEYPCVILPLTTAHYVMLQRNLLYTAVTRAQKMMIIIGTKNALAVAVNNNRVIERHTSLFR